MSWDDFWDGAGRVGMDIVTLGGYENTLASRKASKTQSKAAQDAMDMQQKQYDENVQRMQPFIGAGQYGLDQQMGMLKSGEAYQPYGKTFADFYSGKAPTYSGPGQAPAPYQGGDFNFTADPGAAYRQKMAMDAVQHSAASKGMLNSSASLKNLQQNASDLAAQDYQNSWNRYMGNRQQGQAEQAQGFNQYANARNFGRDVYQQDLDQSNRNRLPGYGQYRDALTDYTNNLRNKYSDISNLASAGMMGTSTLNNMGTNNSAALQNLLIQQANARAASQMATGSMYANIIPNWMNTLAQGFGGTAAVGQVFGGGGASSGVTGSYASGGGNGYGSGLAGAGDGMGGGGSASKLGSLAGLFASVA